MCLFKGIVISVVLFVHVFKCDAQTNVYHPFADTNAVWRIDWYSGTTGMCVDIFNFHSSFQYTLEGDTTINSMVYKKIYRSGYTVCSPFYSTYWGGLRQDTVNKKVYFLRPGNADTLIYNFNAQVGDTLKLADCSGFYGGDVGYSFIVSVIDSVLVGNKYHKRFTDSNVSFSSMIEGLGSSSGLLEGNMPYSLEQTLNLICYSHNNDFYPAGSTSCPLLVADVRNYSGRRSEVHIFPNPVIDLLSIQTDRITGRIVVRNFLGELVLQIESSINDPAIDLGSLPPGVYSIFLLGKNYKVVKL